MAIAIHTRRGVGLVQRSPAVGNGGSGVGGGLPRVPGAGASDADADTVPETNATVDESGDLPPSYEEALNMPTPLDPESPFYANLDTGNLCKNAEENSKT
nr:hypothetical protein BaRGS_025895 [Batillaria attramentaria]